MAFYMLRGRANAWWLPSVAGANPTAAEIAAGQELGDSITALSGFEPQTSKINIPIMKQIEEAQLEGPKTFQDAVLTIAEDDGTGTDAGALQRIAALTTLVAGAQGVLYLSRTKKTSPAAADKGFMMRATVGSQVPGWNLDASAATTNVNLNPTTNLLPVTIAA